MPLSKDQLEAHWRTLSAALSSRGPSGVLDAIRAESDPALRDQLFRLAIRKLGFGLAPGGPKPTELDQMLVIGNAAIDHALEQAELASAPDILAKQPDRISAWLDAANIAAYNLSANLCDCWGDGDSRERRHFEHGVDLADRALELRTRLKKPAGPFAMAHWLRAKHLLSLGQHSEAALAFAESLRFEREKSDATGRGEAIAASSPGSLLAATIYAAYSALRAQTTNPDTEIRDEAQMYLDQLRETFRRN